MRGALGVLRVHLQIFPVNYAYNFFSALGVQVHPLHPWLRLCYSRSVDEYVKLGLVKAFCLPLLTYVLVR